MPDLVGDDLVVGILHDEADLCRLLRKRNIGKVFAAEEDAAAAVTVGGQDGLQVAQERGLAGAGLAAEDHIVAPVDGQINIVKDLSSCFGVGKGQIFDLKMRHVMASFQLRMMGISRSAQ